MIVIDGWKIDTYETKACGLAQKIESPSGRTAAAVVIGLDGRLSQLGTNANLDFMSESLKLTPTLVHRMVRAAKEHVDHVVAEEPEFALVNI